MREPGLGDWRVERPFAARDALNGRRRRTITAADGAVFLVAADHPARGALGVGARPLALADRGVLLRRLTAALRNPRVDGVLATADIIDDLAVTGALDGKIVAGSMNRGGLRGASFEIDDRFTGYDVEGLSDNALDFGKVLLRIDYDDAGSVSTLESVSRVVSDAARRGIRTMVEPFISRRRDGLVHNDLSTEAVIHSVAIASGLGSDSSHTWLKLPVVENMPAVMAATTLPTLLLGGDGGGDPDDLFSRWEDALRLPHVRGLVAGRSLLYPDDDDVEAAVERAARLVHRR